MDYQENRIVLYDDAKNRLKEGISELTEAVLVTMGPGGMTVIISDSNGAPYITKDGVSVAKSISFEDPIKNIGANLIKEVAINTVNEAGDGTTTSICLANGFIDAGFKLIKAGMSYREVKEHLENLEKEVIEKLYRIREEVSDNETIGQVATIASNNDFEIGRLIAQAYDFADTVKITQGNTEHDIIDLIDGMELDTGFFSNAFINVGHNQSIEYEESVILIVEGHLTSLKEVNKIVQNIEPGTPIIIVADSFTNQVVRVLKDNYNRGSLVTGLIKSPGYAEHRVNLMNDLAIATQAITPVGVTSIRKGHIKSIKATKNKTVISYNRDKIVDEYLEELSQGINTLKDDYSKELMQQRIDNLKGSLANIIVGGKSELETRERFDRIEDAVLATKCAIEDGIVDGGGLALFGISEESKNIFSSVLKQPFNIILLNNNKVTERFREDGIVDPVKVVKVALKNAISVTKTILGTEAIILNRDPWR